MSYPPPPGYGAPGGFPPPGGGFGPAPVNQTNGLAIGALVCGILSIVACLFPLGLVAVPLGIVALKKARDLNGSGRGMAIGGIITGILGIIAGIVVVVVLVFAADSVDDINSDPSDGVCDQDRFIQDPDC